MRTMYIAYERTYTDCEGRNSEWTERAKCETIENAREVVKTFGKPEDCGMYTGDWKITAKTMDEESFSITENMVESFDWWKEVGQREHAERMIKAYTKDMEMIENSKKNCKTEKGIERKNKEIERYKTIIERYKKMLA